MKITIYELLGLIKDGKAPKKIRVDDYILELVENETNWKFAYIDGYDDYLFVDYHLRLDDTLEILEEVEDKEYECIEEIQFKEEETISIKNILKMGNTINALIRNQKYILDYIKQLENNWKELKKWLEKQRTFYHWNTQGYSMSRYDEVLDKMQEIKVEE